MTFKEKVIYNIYPLKSSRQIFKASEIHFPLDSLHEFYISFHKTPGYMKKMIFEETFLT